MQFDVATMEVPSCCTDNHMTTIVKFDGVLMYDTIMLKPEDIVNLISGNFAFFLGS